MRDSIMSTCVIRPENPLSIRRYSSSSPQIDATAWIDPTALVIGDVTIGPHSSLWPFAVARGDVNRVLIGSRTNIQDHCMLHVSHAGPFNPGRFFFVTCP